jgi:hypothetical protein
LHARTNFRSERQHVRGAGAAAVDERESVARRDSGSSTLIAFRKSGVLDEPGRWDFHHAWSGWEARRFLTGCRSNPLRVLLTDDGILEEAAGAATVRIAIDQQHSLRLANPAHLCGDFDKSRLDTIVSLGFKGALQVGVAERGCATGREPEIDARNDEAAAVS